MVEEVSEIELGPGPDAVPAARRFARDVLADAPDGPAADAELVLSELVTNAALHGAPPIRCRLRSGPDTLRIEVQDAGRSLPVRLAQRPGAMTGRGIGLVEALSQTWGVEPAGAAGKVVWAEVTLDGSPGSAGPTPDLTDVDVDALLAFWADEEAEVRYRVRLGGVPTDFLLEAKTHIDNVVRELTLMSSDNTDEAGRPAGLTDLVETVMSSFADARGQIKRLAAAAAANAEAITDLELQLSSGAADAGERYLKALQETDRWARSAHLLTLAPPRSHVLFRHWYVSSVVEQLRAASHGEPPPLPVPFATLLAMQVDRLDRLEDLASRLQILHDLNRDLAQAVTLEEMAGLSVRAAADNLAVETARVYFAEGGMLHSSARYAKADEPEGYREFSIDADLPAAIVARTGEDMNFRSLREIYNRFPDLTGYYPSERSLSLIPVAHQGHIYGVLALTFAGGELAEDAQGLFARAVAEALALAVGNRSSSQPA